MGVPHAKGERPTIIMKRITPRLHTSGVQRRERGNEREGGKEERGRERKEGEREGRREDRREEGRERNRKKGGRKWGSKGRIKRGSKREGRKENAKEILNGTTIVHTQHIMFISHLASPTQSYSRVKWEMGKNVTCSQ